MPNPGLGDEFTKATGLHASDPSTWKQQIDFSLDWARKHGWSPWMGAKAEGITGMMGIGNAPPQQQASAGMPAAQPIQPPPVNPPAPAPQPGYVDPAITTAGRPDAPPMPPAAAPGEVASLDPSIGIPMPGAAGQMRASAPAQPIAPQRAPHAALSPLPSSSVGPTPDVASVPPVGMPTSQIPPEFQNSPQLMNADPNKGILQAILGGSPASPEQVAQAQQSGQARLAQALDGASPQQAQNPMANPRAQELAKVLMNPNVPAPMKQMAAQQLQTLMKPPEFGFQTLPDGTVLRSDPRTGTLTPVYRSEMSQADQARLKIEQDKLDYERNKPTEVNGRLIGPDGKVVADFGNGDWDKLENGSLFNKKTGEVRSAQAAGGTAGFRFNGNSVEAQSLNGLIDSKAITPEQAQQLGAGKTITGPNGEIIFLTPRGVFGSPAGGGTPQPLNAPQAPQGAPIDLFGDGGGAAPADAPPVAPPAPVAAPSPQGQPPQGAQNNGVIPITAPKAATNEQLNAAGFADRMHRAGGLLDKYEQQGLNATDQFLTGSSLIPGVIGNGIVGKTNPDYQLFDQARRDFINAQLRRESGAVIGPDEFNNANKQYFPQPGDGPKVIEQKREARKMAIESMGRSAGPNYKQPTATGDNGGAPGQSTDRPRATNPQTGETVEFDGTQWVPVK